MSEKDKLLHQISVLDFTLVDLLLYLDTHPYDQRKAITRWKNTAIRTTR